MNQPTISPDDDQIAIDDLRLRALIGIFDHERERRQDVCLNVVMATDVATAAKSDAIEDALDYKSVTKRIIDLVEQSEYFLIETLAETIAARVLDEFPVRVIRLRIDKPGALRHARTVGISITRGRP